MFLTILQYTRRKDDKYFPARLSVGSVKGKEGDVDNYIILLDNLTNLKQKDKKIQELSNQDMLTQLSNNFAFKSYLKSCVEFSDEYSENFSLLCIRINDFKSINSSLGYQVGDKIMVEVAKRLHSIVKNKKNLGRISTSEFTIINFKKNSMMELNALSRNIIQLFKTPFLIDGKNIYLSINIGIGIFPDDGKTPEHMLKAANTAMLGAKMRGGNSVEFFSKELNSKLNEKFEIASRIPKALQRNEFIVHYQPQINLFTNKIEAFEALIRWENPDLGFLPPNKFIQIAEETGHINEIGLWVIYKSCSQFKKWLDAGHDFKKIAVNVSPVQFKNPSFVRRVKEIIETTNIPPNCVELEITENVLIENIEVTMKKLKKLKLLGIGIALDDFGIGYSCLKYIKEFPLDKIKIDREFIREFPHNDDGSIAKIIVSLANNLNLDILAEGIETEEQLTFMKRMGVHKGQGHYFGRSVDAKKIDVLVQKFKKEKNAVV